VLRGCSCPPVREARARLSTAEEGARGGRPPGWLSVGAMQTRITGPSGAVGAVATRCWERLGGVRLFFFFFFPFPSTISPSRPSVRFAHHNGMSSGMVHSGWDARQACWMGSVVDCPRVSSPRSHLVGDLSCPRVLRTGGKRRGEQISSGRAFRRISSGEGYGTLADHREGGNPPTTLRALGQASCCRGYIQESVWMVFIAASSEVRG
jgi:hypothetical protein